MKIVGALLIIGACWMIGTDFYKSNCQKLEYAKDLFSAMEFLKSEIAYTCDLLGNSVLKAVAFSGRASEFMENLGRTLCQNGVSSQSAFEENEQILAKGTNNETFLITKDLILQLGEKDCENHEKMFESYLNKLTSIIKKQEIFCQKECAVFRKTGAIIGLGIVVLLV